MEMVATGGKWLDSGYSFRQTQVCVGSERKKDDFKRFGLRK